MFLRRCQLIARVFKPVEFRQEATLECQREEFSPPRRESVLRFENETPAIPATGDYLQRDRDRNTGVCGKYPDGR